MTVIQYNNQGIACPLAQCDVCSEIITDATGALVVWEGPENTRSMFLCEQCDDAGSADDMNAMALERIWCFCWKIST